MSCSWDVVGFSKLLINDQSEILEQLNQLVRETPHFREAEVAGKLSRTSTQHCKSAPENLPEIARQLGVAHTLEGSVQKSGEAVRVNRAADQSRQ